MLIKTSWATPFRYRTEISCLYRGNAMPRIKLSSFRKMLSSLRIAGFHVV
jgi:hypothetical protein